MSLKTINVVIVCVAVVLCTVVLALLINRQMDHERKAQSRAQHERVELCKPVEDPAARTLCLVEAK